MELSKTEWDEYLKSINPDVPTFLSDYATLYIHDIGLLRYFWSKLVLSLDKGQLEDLKRWLETKGSELTNHEVSFKWKDIFG